MAVCLGNRQRRSADAGVGDDDAAQKIDGIPDRKSRDSPVERRRVIERQQTIAIREGNRLSCRNRAAELECGTITYRERPAAGDTAEDDGSAIRLNTHRAGIVECERASGRGREDACAGDIDRSRIVDRVGVAAKVVESVDIPYAAGIVVERCTGNVERCCAKRDVAGYIARVIDGDAAGIGVVGAVVG